MWRSVPAGAIYIDRYERQLQDPFLMQARGTGAVEREPTDQHDARLRAGSDNRAHSAETASEALAEEPRQ